ncbi:MAG: glutamate ligase domain-containing protein, partial [Candidatus Eiseniibacteriota bacterium]
AAAWELGIPFATIRAALADFAGVGRRLELRGEVAGAPWIDDYGHHPTEIAAALAALQVSRRRRIIAVFQPHRYTRTMALLDRFATCFSDASEVILLPIYPAGERPIEGVTSAALADAIRRAGGPRVELAASFEEAACLVEKTLTSADVLLTIGAGDVYRVGDLAREARR